MLYCVLYCAEVQGVLIYTHNHILILDLIDKVTFIRHYNFYIHKMIYYIRALRHNHCFAVPTVFYLVYTNHLLPIYKIYILYQPILLCMFIIFDCQALNYIDVNEVLIYTHNHILMSESIRKITIIRYYKYCIHKIHNMFYNIVRLIPFYRALRYIYCLAFPLTFYTNRFLFIYKIYILYQPILRCMFIILYYPALYCMDVHKVLIYNHYHLLIFKLIRKDAINRHYNFCIHKIIYYIICLNQPYILHKYKNSTLTQIKCNSTTNTSDYNNDYVYLIYVFKPRHLELQLIDSAYYSYG
jgi:hypothetical protein